MRTLQYYNITLSPQFGGFWDLDTYSGSNSSHDKGTGQSHHQNVITYLSDMKKEVRPLKEIANEILLNWKKPSEYAMPYIKAMATLDTVDDHYMWDTGKDVVMYFLANSALWQGEKADAIKKELKKIVGLYAP